MLKNNKTQTVASKNIRSERPPVKQLQQGVQKKLGGGMIKKFSPIARPQRFVGVF